MMTWSEPAIERVRVLWEEGVSCSEIARTLADELGMQTTRNAVIGLVHRKKLGAHRRRRQPVLSPPRPRSQVIRRATKYGNRIAAEVSTPGPLPLTPADDLRIPLAQRRTLLELTESTCRWPVGEPREKGFFFCGATAVHGHVYCPWHCRRAYNGFGASKYARQSKESECTGR